ncbi:unnamed protein product [Heterobilharzia americana]|nr:unnamed protein product [Heterobilharzia americana]
MHGHVILFSIRKTEIFLVILGLDNAGKTTTTRSIKGVSNDLIAPTIGFDRIEFAIDRFNINLYDLGGGRTIRDIWETYFAEVYGVIFVVDSSAPERLEECHEVLGKVLAHPCISGKPVLLLANKRDIKDAVDESELIAALQLDDLVNQHQCPCRLECCCALLLPGKKLDKAIRDGLKWLLAYIESEMTSLQSRVHADVARQAREQAVEREARKERVRLAREERERLEKLSSQQNGKLDSKNTSQSDNLTGADDISNDMTSHPLSVVAENTNLTKNGYEDKMANDDLLPFESNNFLELPEPKLCRDSQFMPSSSVTSKEKNNPLACSLLNSRDLIHQIQLACSIDMEFTNRGIGLSSCHHEDKNGLLIDEEVEGEVNDNDDEDEEISENEKAATIQEKEEISTLSLLSPSMCCHLEKDRESKTEVVEMNILKTKDHLNKAEFTNDDFMMRHSPKSSIDDDLISPVLNSSVRSQRVTPMLIQPLYGNNNFSVKKSTTRLSDEQINTFGKAIHENSSRCSSKTSSPLKKSKGPSPLARILVPDFNKLHPMVDQKSKSTESTSVLAVLPPSAPLRTTAAANGLKKPAKSSLRKSYTKPSK